MTTVTTPGTAAILAAATTGATGRHQIIIPVNTRMNPEVMELLTLLTM